MFFIVNKNLHKYNISWRFFTMNLNEAKQILHKNGLMLVDKALNESGHGDTYYTGLLYKNGEYAEIVSSAIAQITDGIGEGSDRTAGIFRYYFRDLVNEVDTFDENGELVITCPTYCLRLLMNCIWRVASIEREDNGSKDRDIYYDYLDGDWKDICKLNAAIKKIIDNGFNTQPMTEEQKQDRLNKIEIAKQKAEEKAKAAAEKAKIEAEKAEQERIAKEKEKKRQLNDKIEAIDSKLSKITPDAKDMMRAKDANSRYSKSFYDYFNKGLRAQLFKIKDDEKKKRRIAAFFKVAKENRNINDAYAELFDKLAEDPNYEY